MSWSVCWCCVVVDAVALVPRVVCFLGWPQPSPGPNGRPGSASARLCRMTRSSHAAALAACEPPPPNPREYLVSIMGPVLAACPSAADCCSTRLHPRPCPNSRARSWELYPCPAAANTSPGRLVLVVYGPDTASPVGWPYRHMQQASSSLSFPRSSRLLSCWMSCCCTADGSSDAD